MTDSLGVPGADEKKNERAPVKTWQQVFPRRHDISDGVSFVEPPIDYRDGYRVTVSWGEEDNAWLSAVEEMRVNRQISDGPTQVAALLNLVCSMACLVDTLAEEMRSAHRRLEAMEKERGS